MLLPAVWWLRIGNCTNSVLFRLGRTFAPGHKKRLEGTQENDRSALSRKPLWNASSSDGRAP